MLTRLKSIFTRIQRLFVWKHKINLLLKAIATQDDVTGWCLYSCMHDKESGIFIETCVYWYSNARFEFFRTSATSKIDEIRSEESDEFSGSGIKSSSIVAEEGYLIRRILTFLDPSDFVISYHPQPEDEDSEIERIVKEEVREALGEFDDEEDEDDEEASGQGVN